MTTTTAPAATTEAKPTKAKKKRGISFSHVALAFIANGVTGKNSVQEVYDGGDVSRDTVRAAIKEVERLGKDASTLKTWYADVLGGPLSAPEAGETRSFTAQVQKGSPTAFIKVPLPGFKRGDKADAYYHENGEVSISKAAPVLARPVAAEDAKTAA